MALFNFRREQPQAAAGPAPLEALLQGFSMEVMPRTAEKVTSFRDLLPAGTRVYIAHIEGTPIEDMVATARRINGEAVTLDLSRLRVAGIGGDMVRADVLENFGATLSVANFRAQAFLPSYGMAETTLAISFVDADKPSQPSRSTSAVACGFCQ